MNADWVDSTRPFFDCFFLLAIVIGAASKLNTLRNPPWCMRMGLALVIGGSAGVACEWWLPQATEYWADITLHAGGALTMIAYTREDLRAFVVGQWNEFRKRLAAARVRCAPSPHRVS